MSLEKVNFLIPMAGAGSRFFKAGYNIPKPLIDVFGEPMIKWAVKSFDFLDKIDNYQLIFVILEEHDNIYDLGNKLKNIFGDKAMVIKLNKITRGQAETCLAAKKQINNKNKLFIYNCDTYSTSAIWDLILAEDPDGILPCFKSDDPRYSFARINEVGDVVETAEKKAISNLATTGMYYFKHGHDFVNVVEKMISENNLYNNEFYVAPCYNELITIGKKIKTILVDKNFVMGTPEELNIFIKSYNPNDQRYEKI